jgi:TRAP-type C4-dicarboxylate transport system permease small subunit
MMEESTKTETSNAGPAQKGATLVARFAGFATFLSILCAMLVICYEVMARYVFSWPTVWEIEAAIFLLILATFVGSVYALKDDAHISMDVVAVLIRPRARAKLNVFTSFASMLFCILVSVSGWKMWWEAYSMGWHSDSIWAPPLWIPYIFLPIGFTLMSLQFLLICIGHIISIFNPQEKS